MGGGLDKLVFVSIIMYNTIISVENLLGAWKEFLKGKRGKKDVQEFQYRLSDNVLALHQDLKDKTYIHGGYHAFNISDPKPRNIHKATVKDRFLHHAIYRQLYSFFDQTFIYDSYSCRKLRGTHKALKRFRDFAYKVSRNHTETLWVLKCDVRRFFASIDQRILINTMQRYITNQDTLWLIQQVTQSFQSTSVGKGMPLGNLTSQLLVNVYMNEFDQFVKHTLKAEYYIRYADDFVILNRDREWLFEILTEIETFLEEKLKLKLHPDKVSIKTFSAGVDFLGRVHFSDHRVLRTSTKRRMFKRLEEKPSKERTASYLGLLQHGNTHVLQKQVEASYS